MTAEPSDQPLDLLPLTAATLADIRTDPAAFGRAHGLDLGGQEAVLRDVAEQMARHDATPRAPWCGYLAVALAPPTRRRVVGTCAFTGPPDAEGAVEIAYFTYPPYEGQGFGRAMAGALVELARRTGSVRMVYALTLREPNASTRILTRLGFRRVGEAMDPDAGRVWRWELPAAP